MNINPDADVGGLIPKEYKDRAALILKIVKPIDEEERKGQYRLVVTDEEGTEKSLRFLWERQLAPLAKEFGSDADTWVGKKIAAHVDVSTSEKRDKDGDPFYNWVLRPFEQKVKV